MAPYFWLFAAPAVLCLANPQTMRALPTVALFLFLVVFIGLRQDDIGPDGWGYSEILHNHLPFETYFSYLLKPSGEPLFFMMFKLTSELNWGLYGVNIISTIVFCVGIFMFCSHLREPWLGILTFCSFPVLFVGMSAIRQAISMGLILILLSVWRNTRFLSKVITILFSAMFHFSAVLTLAFAFFGARMSNLQKLLAGASALGLIYVLYNSAQATVLQQRYIGSNSEASGAYFHVSIVLIPAVIYFVFRKRWTKTYGNDTFMFYMSASTFVLLPLLYLSTIVASRTSFYFSIVPAYVWSGLPSILGANKRNQIFVRLGIVVAMASIFFGWLSLANVASAYVPYKSILFED